MPKKRESSLSPPLLLRTPELQAFYEEAFKTFSAKRDLEGRRLLDRLVRKLAAYHFDPAFAEALQAKREALRAEIRMGLLRNFPIPLDELFLGMLLLHMLYRVDDRASENELRREFGYPPLPKGTNLDWLVRRMKHIDEAIYFNRHIGRLTLENLWEGISRLRQGLPLNLNLQGLPQRRVPPGEDLRKEYSEIRKRATPLLQICRDLNVEPGEDDEVKAAFPTVASRPGVPRFPSRFADYLLAMKYGVQPETVKKARQRATHHQSRN